MNPYETIDWFAMQIRGCCADLQFLEGTEENKRIFNILFEVIDKTQATAKRRLKERDTD